MSHPAVRMIAHSVSDQGIPLITVHLRYWRGIHAELMTHRVFSRNARSSRAVPVSKMLEEIRNDPFVPKHWGKNQKGMQASEECTARVTLDGETMWNHAAWLKARDHAVNAAEAFMEAGYHKQIANRLLEPFMWIDTLVTATDWANFMALRDHKDAEPHIRDLAQAIKEAIAASTAEELTPGDWHLPYIDQQTDKDIWKFLMDHEEDEPFGPRPDLWTELKRRISAARCARISYAPFDGDGSIQKELDRYQALVENWPVHASPVEHQATPDTWSEEYHDWDYPNRHRNFRGWIQHRSFIENETVWDK